MMKKYLTLFVLIIFPVTPQAQASKMEGVASFEYGFLKSYIDMRFSEMQRTIDLSRAAMDHRLMGMNEVREQLNRQSQTFTPKGEFNGFKEQTEKDLKELNKSKDKLEGMATQQSMWIVLAVSLTSLVFGVVGLIMRWKKI